jgi:hypothetical protein
MPIIVGIVVVLCLVVTIVNMLADILYSLIDPRLNLRGPKRRRSWGLSRFRARPRMAETATEG